MRHTASIAILILLAACAVQPPPAAEQPPAQVAPPVVPETPYDEPELEAPPVREPNADVQALSSRADEVRSYSFQLANLPEKTGNRKYYVRGDRAKVQPVTPLQMDGWSADYIYLDYAQNTATAYCIDLGQCRGLERKAAVSFEEYAIKLPPQWLDEVQYGSKEAALQYNSRPVAVVRWQEGVLTYEAYLDSFYGFPQRVAIITGTGEDAVVTGGYEYQGMAFNNLKEEDVTPPY